MLNGQTSDWASVLAGVPQGSILGPLLFLIYINDIVTNIGCSIRLFADDTSLYTVVECPNTAARLLNGDLETIFKKANDWLVTFNANKTLSMIISRKIYPVLHPLLFMNDIMLKETDMHKHLGLLFTNTCDWSKHVVNISEKASIRLNLMRVLKFRVSRKSLEKIYFADIRPLLEYNDAVWDNCSTATKKQLDAIHLEAARIISGATKLCSIDKLFSELGWESLQTRRDKHKLIIFYKILHGLAPNYLADLIPPLVQNRSSYNLRNSDHIQYFQANTNLFRNFFFPSTIRAWNSLQDDIKQAPSVASFKYRLNRNLKRPSRYYNSGTHIGQVLQARLRMQCSSLNADLYSKNIVESPSCQCGSFESAYHFFFACPRFTAERRRYLPETLPHYSVRELLSGKDNATEQDNETLFLQVQDYIVKSGRFV